MKKILFIVVMMLSFCVNANAQMWHIDETQTDELKGTKANKLAIFLSEDGDACVINIDEFVIWVKTYKGVFDYEKIDDIKFIKVLVGYYVDNKLIDKDTIDFFVTSSKFAALYKNEKYYTKIVNHLKTKGNVRFVIERYEDIDFDITLPMNKDLPMYKSLN